MGLLREDIHSLGRLRVQAVADHATGELQSVDGYMNIALEKTQEFVNGTKRREYGDTFVRGNNGTLNPLIHQR